MYAIGIDIGTTSICGVLIDVSNGKMMKQKTVVSNTFITTGNSWEKIQDVSKIISLAKKVLEELLMGCPEVLVISLTGQMHGMVYVNGEGVAVSPLYTWQDERGNLSYKDTTYAAYLGSYSGYGWVTDFYKEILQAANANTSDVYGLMALLMENEAVLSVSMRKILLRAM